jgi:hypothetical protein
MNSIDPTNIPDTNIAVFIRGASKIKSKIVKSKTLFQSVDSNVRVSFEIEGSTATDKEWNKIRKIKKTLAAVI